MSRINGKLFHDILAKLLAKFWKLVDRQLSKVIGIFDVI